jgi:FKBP-type peptidyl-prolyl cis-trans isomerase SlyD
MLEEMRRKRMTDPIMTRNSAILDSKYYVKIQYRVKVVGGPILKGTQSPELMDFVTGFGHVIPGLEKRLLGRRTGEKLSFVVPPHEAFGERFDELVFEKKRADFRFPVGLEPYPGMELPLVSDNLAAPDTVIIREVRDDSIVVDCNHPLAGLSLEYDLEIVEARPARDTDMCAEWEEKVQDCDAGCSCSPHEIVLPGEQEKS